MPRAAVETHSDTVRGLLRSGTRRRRVDLIGPGALLIAGLALAGTINVARTPAPEASDGLSMFAAGAPASPARDRWYLEDARQAPNPPDQTAAMTEPATRASTVARDQWYLDRGLATALPVWEQTRDRWYLDMRVTTDVPKDRWYSDPQKPNR